MSDRFLPHIAREIVHQPLLIHPDKLAIIAEVLGGRIGIDAGMLELGPDASRFAGRRRDPKTDEFLTYARTEEGAAIITITGSLVNRGAWVGASSGLTSYEGIKHQLANAMGDGQVRGILLDLETPGGLAIGMPEVAAAVGAAAAVKPVIAVVNGMAASAGYGIASGASRIIVTPSGLAGSIGVKLLHVDYSRMLDRAGITPTLISMPDDGSKTLANPFAPLSEDAFLRLKADIVDAYEMFLDTIVTGRPLLTKDAIRALGAHVYAGQKAVDAGLADEVGTFESALADLFRARGHINSHRGATMKTETTPPLTAAETGTFTQADLDRARGEGHAAGKTEGIMEGAAGERGRISAILDHAEAAGREPLARHYAFKTDVRPETAVDALKVAAKAGAAAADPLATLAREANVTLGPAPAAPANTAQIGWAKSVARVNRARGFTQ